MSSAIRLEDWQLVVKVRHNYKKQSESGILHIQGAVYGAPGRKDGTVIVTSTITGSTGRIVHCDGRDYLLGKPLPSFVAWLAKKGDVIDAEQPICLEGVRRQLTWHRAK